MKFNPAFQLRNVCGEHVMVATGAAYVDFNRLITLNETAFDLYEAFAHREFTDRDLVQFLLENYSGVTAEQAAQDVAQMLEEFQKEELIRA